MIFFYETDYSILPRKFEAASDEEAKKKEMGLPGLTRIYAQEGGFIRVVWEKVKVAPLPNIMRTVEHK